MSFHPSHAATPAAESTRTTTSSNDRALRAAIKIVLQDDGRRRGVEPRLSRSPVFIVQCEAAFRFATRQPLVLEVDRQRGFHVQLLRELLDAGRHVGRRSIETT